LKVIIDTSPKFRRINIEIDGKDYSQILHKRSKQYIVWAIRKELMDLDEMIEKMPKLPPSVVIPPNSLNCNQCTAILHNCAKYFRFLHGKIEVCSVLYDLILDHKLSNIIPIINKEIKIVKSEDENK